MKTNVRTLMKNMCTLKFFGVGSSYSKEETLDKYAKSACGIISSYLQKHGMSPVSGDENTLFRSGMAVD